MEKNKKIYYALIPDGVKLGLADENKIVAIFKHRKHAEMFGDLMYKGYFLIEETEWKN